MENSRLRFLPRYVYPRRRSRGDGELWEAGWGLIWDVRGVEVDLSIFHDETAIDLNGLMNVDRIHIPFGTRDSLNEVAAAMLTVGSPEAAIETGLVHDPCGGYASWVHRSPAIVAWNAILASPIECAIRIVRACAHKLHLNHLHAELADPLRAAILTGHERGDRFIRVRSLVKLFHDDRVGVELEMMHEAGRLPGLGFRDRRRDRSPRPRRVDLHLRPADREGRKDFDHHAAFAQAGEQGGGRNERARLEALLSNMPIHRAKAVLAEIALAEPTFSALVQNQLPRVEKRRAVKPATANRPRHDAFA